MAAIFGEYVKHLRRDHSLAFGAYMSGTGLFSFINSTILILATSAIVEIVFDRWLQFVMPMRLIFIVETIIAMLIAVYIYYYCEFRL